MTTNLTLRSGGLRMLHRTLGPASLALTLGLGLGIAVAFTGCGGGGSSSPAPITPPPSAALAIATQPANAAGAVGATATFTVAASGGTTPYTYLWSKTPKGGTAAAIATATAASYTTPALALVDDGATFTVTVKDAASGSVTSNAATLTVTAPPPGALAVTLADQTVVSGTTATFTPVVTGGKAPFTYAWKKGTTALTATTATYTTAATVSSDEGAQYVVTVTDASTPAVTATATATLHVTNPSLTTLFNTTLSPAPGVVFLLLDSNNKSMDGGVSIDERVYTSATSWVGFSQNVLNTNTAYLTARTYPIRLQGDSTKKVGSHIETYTVDKTTTVTYQTSKQNWTFVISPYAAAMPPAGVTAPTKYRVDIYQCDDKGGVDWKSMATKHTYTNNPLVLSVTGDITGNPNIVSFTTELFKGTYRATFTPLVGTDLATGVPVLVTAPFTTTGNGATDTNLSFTLAPPATTNWLKLNLAAHAGQTFAANDFLVEVRDRASLLLIGSQSLKADGSVKIPTGNVTDVLVVVTDKRASSPSVNKIVALHSYTDLTPSTAATLNQYEVKGSVTAKVPGADTAHLWVGVNSGFTGLQAELALGLPAAWTYSLPLTTGSIDQYLFEGDWVIKVDPTSIPQCPLAAPLAFTLSADKVNANIDIPAGGVITGTLQTKAGAAVPGVTVELLDPTTSAVLNTTTSDVTTGKYIFYVPFGASYNLRVDNNAVITTALTTSSGASTATQDLTQYPVNGRITDGNAGIAAIFFAGISNNAVAAASDGTFTLKLFQGQNAVWIAPPTGSSLGFKALTDVLVNDATAK